MGPLRALTAAEQGTLVMCGTSPDVALLERPLIRNKPEALFVRAASTPSLLIEKPNLGRRRSHQRNTITIDTLISETPQILEIVNQEAALISPRGSRSSQTGFHEIFSGDKQASGCSGQDATTPLVSPISGPPSPISTTRIFTAQPHSPR